MDLSEELVHDLRHLWRCVLTCVGDSADHGCCVPLCRYPSEVVTAERVSLLRVRDEHALGLLCQPEVLGGPCRVLLSERHHLGLEALEDLNAAVGVLCERLHHTDIGLALCLTQRLVTLALVVGALSALVVDHDVELVLHRLTLGSREGLHELLVRDRRLEDRDVVVQLSRHHQGVSPYSRRFCGSTGSSEVVDLFNRRRDLVDRRTSDQHTFEGGDPVFADVLQAGCLGTLSLCQHLPCGPLTVPGVELGLHLGAVASHDVFAEVEEVRLETVVSVLDVLAIRIPVSPSLLFRHPLTHGGTHVRLLVSCLVDGAVSHERATC